MVTFLEFNFNFLGCLLCEKRAAVQEDRYKASENLREYE
jgi:hypothetical protein